METEQFRIGSPVRSRRSGRLGMICNVTTHHTERGPIDIYEVKFMGSRSASVMRTEDLISDL